jgi:hypothetical protein
MFMVCVAQFSTNSFFRLVIKGQKKLLPRRKKSSKAKGFSFGTHKKTALSKSTLKKGANLACEYVRAAAHFLCFPSGSERKRKNTRSRRGIKTKSSIFLAQYVE